jgi:hypothetical protein
VGEARAGAGAHPQQQAAAGLVAAADHALHGVADGDGEVAVLVQQLGGGDHGVGLGADVHEGGLAADGQDAPGHPLAGLGLVAASGGGLGVFELGEDGAEVGAVAVLGHGRPL